MSVGRREGVAGQGTALGVELQELLGHLARLGRHPAPLLRPGGAAQLVEAHGFGRAAGEAMDDRHPVHRQVERAAAVLEVEEVLGDPADGELG